MSYSTVHSIQSLGIIYSSVSRGTTVLALHSTCHGNFSDVVPQVLSVIPLDSSTDRLTYTSGDYMFHYICEDGVIFLCITDDDFERSKAFMFLENFKSLFFDTYSDRIAQLKPYSLNSTLKDELSRQMELYSEDSYMMNGDQNMIRLDTIRVKTLDSLSHSGIELEQLELMESSDNYSLRSFEHHIVERSNSCRRCCRKYHKPIIVISLLVSFIMVILAAIIIIVLVDDKKALRDLES